MQLPMRKGYIYLFFLIGILGLIFLGFMHEQVHVAIMKQYGINSSVEYFSEFPDFITIFDEPCPTEECILSHNINESIGYHLYSFYILIFFGFLIIILILNRIMEIVEKA